MTFVPVDVCLCGHSGKHLLAAVFRILTLNGHGEPHSSRSSGAAIAFSTKADMKARRQAEAAQRDQAATAARRALEEAVKRNKAETKLAVMPSAK